LVKVKKKYTNITFSALLRCRCGICSCCTCYRVFLAITVHGNRGIIFVLMEASPVTFR